MRKFLISLLLASAAATPALADRPSDRQQARAERQQAREDRQQTREERAAPAERPQFVPRADRANSQPQQSFTGPEHFRTNVRENFDATRAERNVQRESLVAARTQRNADRQQRADQLRENRLQRADQIRSDRKLRQLDRPPPNVMRSRVPVVSDVPRPGTQPPLTTRARPTAAPTWSTNWRNNDRYNWRRWRDRHRSWFHLGIYYDPFGWGYYPYQIGWRMWPSYYSNSFWINDPWQYRLPYAPPGYVWVRYWDDAVLVDTWTGEVVDVIYNFFW